MSTTEIIVLIAVVVIVAALVAALVMSRRAKSQREAASHADELRQEAGQGVSSTLPEAEVQAKRAEADAEEARLIAQRADERAREARTDVVQQEAHHEDKLRTADRLDPRVDDTADDYRPPTAATQTSTDGTDAAAHSSTTDTGHTTPHEDTDGTTDGTHRA